MHHLAGIFFVGASIILMVLNVYVGVGLALFAACSDFIWIIILYTESVFVKLA